MMCSIMVVLALQWWVALNFCLLDKHIPMHINIQGEGVAQVQRLNYQIVNTTFSQPFEVLEKAACVYVCVCIYIYILNCVICKYVSVCECHLIIHRLPPPLLPAVTTFPGDCALSLQRSTADNILVHSHIFTHTYIQTCVCCSQHDIYLLGFITALVVAVLFCPRSVCR